MLEPGACNLRGSGGIRAHFEIGEGQVAFVADSGVLLALRPFG